MGRGPKDMEERRCTDVFCLLIFLLSWAVMGAIAYSHRAGPAALLHGKDYLEHRCGEGEFADAPFVWYPRIADDAFEQQLLMRAPWDTSFYGLCVTECPQAGVAVADYGHESEPAQAKAKSWDAALSTFAVLNRCVPREEHTKATVLLCAEPSCEAAGMPCLDDELAAAVGVGPADATQVWELTPETEHRCRRAVHVEHTATTLQPNAGPFLTWAFRIASTVERVYEALLANSLRIVAIGVGCSTPLNFLWLLLLRCCAGFAV